jgi:phage N-6-adenine-methyltransferase
MANDMWQTPPEVIDYIQSRFGKIELDLCASLFGKVCDNYIDIDQDFLNDMHIYDDIADTGALCFFNPPYSNPLPFVQQAIKWSQAGYAVAGILNNDTSTKWYVELANHAAIIMPITGGRIAFLDEDKQPINGNNKPQLMFYLAPFGSHTKAIEHVSIDEIYVDGKPKRVE